jgi:hypothetical protein
VIRAGGLIILAAALARCTCDSPAPVDGGYACKDDVDCAEGFFCLRGVCAAVGTDAGPTFDAGSFSGALAFTSTSRTAVSQRCSPQLTFALQDDAGMTQAAPFDVTVQVDAVSGVSFFSDDACANAVTQLTVPKGQSGGSFRFIAGMEGNFDVTLSSPPLDPAVQTQSVVAAGMDVLVFTTLMQPDALAGTCLGPFTVTLQDPAGSPDVVAGGVMLTAMSSPSGLDLFSDSKCTMSAQPVIPDGSASATFYARAVTGTTYQLNVGATNVAGTQQSVNVVPLIRSGTCDMSPNQLNVQCVVDPPVLDTHRTTLLYQATGAETLVEDVETTCLLLDSATVQCARGGNTGSLSVTWQTVEVNGAVVDRYESGCMPDGGVNVTIGLDASVPGSSVFTLVDSNAQGTDPNANDFFSVDNDGQKLSLQWEQACSAVNLFVQVVKWPFARVRRSSGSVMSGAVEDSHSGLPTPDGGFFVLGTWRSDSPIGATSQICDRLIRPFSPADDTLGVSRGAGSMDSACSSTNITEYSLERVELGPFARSQQLTVMMDPGTDTQMVTIQPVDLTRTFVLAPGQSGGLGQAVGEGAFLHLSDGGSPLGEVSATLTLNSPTELQVARGTSNDAAVFTVFVVELQP